MYQCPSRDEWLRYLGDGLPREASDDMDEHLSSCDECTVLLEELSGPPLELRFAVHARSSRLPEIPGYVITRELGSGGMGVVYLADQKSPSRQVAIKMIQGGPMVMDRHRSRFQIEANAMAQLQHPHIAQVFEVGSVGDQPYIAMEFLGGGSLNDPAHVPSTAAETAELVRTLALAVQHAHDRGVIHRDLKPGNVLFTGDGIAKLCDFGLAKLADTPLNLTRDAVIGTAPYMAPEQVTGSTEVTVQTDVYALGAILYELLCERPPFHGESRQEILDQVRSAEPSLPRSTRFRIPLDLETITLKCLEKSPTRRYRQAGDLAEDLERFLQDRPIRARSAPAAEKVAKWARRHPVLTLSIVGPSILAAVTGWFNLRLQESNKNLAVASDRALKREALAVAAVKQFRDAVQSNPELKNRLELEGLRKALLKEPLEFFRELRDQLQADQDPKFDALEKLADASIDLAATTAEIGDVSDAIRVYSDAIPLWERIVRERPDVSRFRRSLALCYNNRGLLLRDTGKAREGLEAIRQALVIRERLALENPADTKDQSHLAASYINRGDLLRDEGRTDEALTASRKGLDIWERLARENPGVDEFEIGRATGYHNIARLLGRTTKVDEARKMYDRALEIDERLAREKPDNPKYQTDLALDFEHLGILLSEMGHHDDAIEAARRALGIRERLAQEYPTVTQYQNHLATSHITIGNLRTRSGQLPEALDEYRLAASMRERMAKANPRVIEFWRDLAVSHNNVGYVLNNMSRRAEALAAYRESNKILERVFRESPSTVQLESDLAASYDNIGIILGEMNDLAEAMKSHQQSLKIRERLSRDHPTILHFQSELAAAFINMGAVMSKTAEPDRAMEPYRKAEEIFERLSHDNPSAPAYPSAVAICLHNMAELDMNRRQWGPARDRLARAIERQRTALAALPGHPYYQLYLRTHLLFMAKAQRELGQWEDSLRSARELATLAHDHPDELYSAACALASIIPLVGQNGREALGGEAVKTLKESIAAGWKDAPKARSDHDLDSLRARDDFRHVLVQMNDRIFPSNPFAQ